MAKWPRWGRRRAAEFEQVAVGEDGSMVGLERLLVDLDPGLGALLDAIRGVADQLGYDEPIVAVNHARRYAEEIPSAEHRGMGIIPAFLESAAATVRDGALVSAPVLPGGARQLVFHRTVSVRHKRKVMEAIVMVEGGKAHIVSYGTPKSLGMSTFSFPTAAESVSDAVLELREVSELETIGSEEQDALRRSLFAEAMASLVGAHCGMTANEAAQFSSGAEHATVSSLVAGSRTLGGYIYGASNYAARAEIDGWYEPCLRRSAIQFLLDEYPTVAAVIDTDDRETVDEMDEELREHAPEPNPFPEHAVPAGLPDSHWWWRLPAR